MQIDKTDQNDAEGLAQVLLRITGRRLPDRETLGGSRADRDYRMPRHDNAST
jgi:hypothetical protein